MIEVTVRCGCSRTMRADGRNAGRYVCGCGASVTLAGLPRFDDRHCPLPRGTRVCNGPKNPDHVVCEPCSVMLAGIALAIPEQAEQLADSRASIDFHQRYESQFSLFMEKREEKQRQFNRQEAARKVCVVYYALLRPGVVKIGTTTQLGIRMDSFRVPAENVLAAEPGHYKLEAQRHKLFAEQRINGNYEDFRLDDQLQAHIDKVRAAHGDPYELVTRILQKQQELAEDPNSELPFLKVE